MTESSSSSLIASPVAASPYPCTYASRREMCEACGHGAHPFGPCVGTVN